MIPNQSKANTVNMIYTESKSKSLFKQFLVMFTVSSENYICCFLKTKKSIKNLRECKRFFCQNTGE